MIKTVGIVGCNYMTLTLRLPLPEVTSFGTQNDEVEELFEKVANGRLQDL